MRFLIIGWALIWYDWGPYNSGLGHPQRGDRLRTGEKAATCPRGHLQLQLPAPGDDKHLRPPTRPRWCSPTTDTVTHHPHAPLHLPGYLGAGRPLWSSEWGAVVSAPSGWRSQQRWSCRQVDWSPCWWPGEWVCWPWLPGPWGLSSSWWCDCWWASWRAAGPWGLSGRTWWPGSSPWAGWCGCTRLASWPAHSRCPSSRSQPDKTHRVSPHRPGVPRSHPGKTKGWLSTQHPHCEGAARPSHMPTSGSGSSVEPASHPRRAAGPCVTRSRSPLWAELALTFALATKHQKTLKKKQPS